MSQQTTKLLFTFRRLIAFIFRNSVDRTKKNDEVSEKIRAKEWKIRLCVQFIHLIKNNTELIAVCNTLLRQVRMPRSKNNSVSLNIRLFSPTVSFILWGGVIIPFMLQLMC